MEIQINTADHGELTEWLNCCRSGAGGHLGAVLEPARLGAWHLGLLAVIADANISETPNMRI